MYINFHIYVNVELIETLHWKNHWKRHWRVHWSVKICVKYTGVSGSVNKFMVPPAVLTLEKLHLHIHLIGQWIFVLSEDTIIQK